MMEVVPSLSERTSEFISIFFCKVTETIKWLKRIVFYFIALKGGCPVSWLDNVLGRQNLKLVSTSNNIYFLFSSTIDMLIPNGYFEWGAADNICIVVSKSNSLPLIFFAVYIFSISLNHPLNRVTLLTLLNMLFDYVLRTLRWKAVTMTSHEQ